MYLQYYQYPCSSLQRAACPLNTLLALLPPLPPYHHNKHNTNHSTLTPLPISPHQNGTQPNSFSPKWHPASVLSLHPPCLAVAVVAVG
jgi:hypothetical protein